MKSLMGLTRSLIAVFSPWPSSLVYELATEPQPRRSYFRNLFILISCFILAALCCLPLPAWAQIPSQPEVASLVSGSAQLTVAAINVENLDPGDERRFAPLGNLIVKGLLSPDIIALIEIQDNDGPARSSITAADQTYSDLIRAIRSAGGPTYQFTDIPPKRDSDGGQPGGNSRVGYLFQPERVTLAEGMVGDATTAVGVLPGPTLSLNPGRIDPTDLAFVNSRKPLAAEFRFNGHPIFLIANHFVSKRGGPASDSVRERQAEVVHDFVEELLVTDPHADVVVLGDLNDFEFSEVLETLEGDLLQNLADFLAPEDRFSFDFRGRLQLLDHILVSQNLLFQGNAEYDIVHAVVGFPGSVSDHDPVLARFTYSERGATPVEDEIEPVSQVDADTTICPGLRDEGLHSCLAATYSVTHSLGYNRARDFMYSQLDNDNGLVSGIYSGFTVRVDPNSAKPRSDAYQNGQGINAEHSWPQSKGAREGEARSDLHHLFPTRVEVNSFRGSKPFAEIPDIRTERWFLGPEFETSIPEEGIDDYSEGSDLAFEPREAMKGDIARALFYFYTVYRPQASRGFFNEQRVTLCQWAELDPVDDRERERSHQIASQQGNENPFVLEENLADRLYCQP